MKSGRNVVVDNTVSTQYHPRVLLGLAAPPAAESDDGHQSPNMADKSRDYSNGDSRNSVITSSSDNNKHTVLNLSPPVQSFAFVCI